MKIGFWAAWTLGLREITRFYRDRGRVLGAFAPPVLFWFLIGSGLGKAFHIPGASGNMDFLQYFFSGTLVLIVLFTSIFSTISIIEDRREGFLQSVLVAPIPRLSLVLGKVVGASLIGLSEGLCFLVFAGLVGLRATPSSLLISSAALFLCSTALTAIGFCLAWILDSSQAFHGVMNLFLMPMWMLSGALFPAESAPGWLRGVIEVNPVTYAVSAVERVLSPDPVAAAALPSLGVSFLVLAAFTAIMLFLSARLAER